MPDVEVARWTTRFQPEGCHWLYRHGWPVARQLFRAWFRWRIEGVEHLPREGPVVVAANHASFLDPPLLGAALPRPIHFMAKAELFAIPGLRGLLRRLGAFPVRRGQSDRQAIRRALELLAAGKVVGVFPEGTRSRSGELLPAQAGVALLALRTGAPVVPVALLGTGRALPPGTWWPRRVPVLIRVGSPLVFPPVERPDKEQLRQVSDEVMQAVSRLLEPP